MSEPTTHDIYAARYIQPYVAPEDTPRVLAPASPLAALQAALSVTADPPPDEAITANLAGRH
jgi:hypothetical protein